MATEVGQASIKLSFDTKSFNSSQKEIETKAITGSGKISAAWTAKMAVIANVATKAFNAVSRVVSNSIGSAVSRIDTLNNFPRVVQSIGYSADEAQKSTNLMADSLDGLPTALDAMASDTQKLAATMGNLAQGEVNATTVGLGLNDMFLAGGKGTETASRAMEQYNQMLAAGKVDMQAWRSLVDAAPGQMNMLAQELVGATANSQDLYEAMKNGNVTFDELNAAIVRLDQEGGANFESFNAQARSATGGIQTSIENIQNSLNKVVASVISGGDLSTVSKQVGQLFSRISELVVSMTPNIVTGISNLMTAIGQKLPGLMNTLVPVLLNSVIDIIISFTEHIGEYVQMIIDLIILVVNTIVPRLPELLMAIVNGIVDGLMTISSPENLQKLLQAALALLMAIVQALPDVIVALVEALPQIIDNIIQFITNPENIKILLEGAVKLFMGLVEAIPRILVALNNAVMNLFNSLWEGVKNLFSLAPEWFQNLVKGAWDGIKNILGAVGNWIYDHIVKPVSDFFTGLWDGIKNGVQIAIDTVKNIFGTIADWINANVILPIVRFFDGLWKGIESGIRAVKEVISNIFQTIVGIIKAPINGIIGGINGVLRTINSITIPDWVPFIGGAHTNFGMIPMLASGGFATGATQAIIGEGGAEVVLPLERNTDNWSGLLAQALEAEMADDEDYSAPVPAVINLNLDGQQIEQVILQDVRRAI